MPSRILDPTGGTRAGAGLKLAERPKAITGATIGLLDNGKQNAREFLEDLGPMLLRDFGVGKVDMYKKKNNTAPITAEEIETLKANCDLVITAVGDCASCSVLAIGDGIALEKAGVPAASVCTEAFRRSSDATASVHGAPGYDYVVIAHPMAGLEADQIHERVENAAKEIVSVLMAQDGAR
jgi:hypothetical protein